MTRTNPPHVSVIRIGNYSARLAANLIHAITPRAMSSAKQHSWRTRMWHHHPPPGRAGAIPASAPNDVLYYFDNVNLHRCEDSQCTSARCGRPSMLWWEKRDNERRERRPEATGSTSIDFPTSIYQHAFRMLPIRRTLKTNLGSPKCLLSGRTVPIKNNSLGSSQWHYQYLVFDI